MSRFIKSAVCRVCSTYLRLTSLALLTLLSVSTSYADTYPSHPIRVLVGYGAGGAVDLVARTVGQAISYDLGQPVVIENKPGAGSNISIKTVIDSPPDGYTLLLATNALAANMALYQPAPFDAEKDLSPIALVGRVPVVLAVRTSSPYLNIKQLLTAAKAKPNSINYGTPGNGSTPHMAIEFFEKESKLSFKHIPSRDGSLAITDVISGQVDMVVVNALEVQSYVKSGQLRVLAVFSSNRSPIFPEVPTVAELGYPGFEESVWYGFVVPAGTPKPMIDRLHDEIQKALATTDVKERIAAVGGEVTPGSTEMFKKLIHSERMRYEKLVHDAGIKPD